MNYNPTGRNGRPRIDQELERLVVRFAQENPNWGYDRIEVELAKLGYTISDQTIANILRRHNIPVWCGNSIPATLLSRNMRL